MPIVDSHCHVSLSWYEPVEALLRQMDANDVEHAILIQMAGQYDNDYQAACVRRHRDRLASVVIVNHEAEDAAERLRREADRGATGVRLAPGARSPGDDPLLIWRTAARLGLSISSGGRGPEFASEEFAALVAELPELKIVIEHLGSVSRPDDDVDFRIRRRVLALSRFPNTFIKFHGLGEICRRAMPVTEPFPFALPVPPILEMAYEAFGPGRMMWGSDFPPVSGREGYRNALRLPLERLGEKGDEALGLLFGQTALSVFPLR